MARVSQQQAEQAMRHFSFAGTPVCRGVYGSGHINDTFLVILEGEPEKRFVLQRINTDVFREPKHLMENIEAVTRHLRRKIEENGGDPKRETLTLVEAEDGNPWHADDDGNYWRVYPFIRDTVSFDLCDTPELFYQSAKAFGHFQRMLADFPARTLYESIPDFHNTAERFRQFQAALRADAFGRAAEAQDAIEFVLKHGPSSPTDLTQGYDAMARKKIPLRVTHNDTKLNNVLFDRATKKGVCVIDLDTVMPGYIMNDFGDSIRFGATTALEDEADLSKVNFDIRLFEIYTKGFMEECASRITREEIALLPAGAMVMTFECGMRFLTDFLSGDTYFKTARRTHNLDRARNQFKLAADMEEQYGEMCRIVKKYS